MLKLVCECTDDLFSQIMDMRDIKYSHRYILRVNDVLDGPTMRMLHGSLHECHKRFSL